MKIVNFKLKIIVMGLLFVATFVVRPVVAFDPSLPNNKYGIHLAQPEEADIKGASELVNSSGGKWGYVTLVIQDNDRNREKWQGVFEKLREAHLIPIIRIATHPEGASWKKPTVEEAKGWADFLNSLEWVVKDRYVILFNEPNHGAEWGGEANPDD
jgi:sugar phosphate isomerase/epimerase